MNFNLTAKIGAAFVVLSLCSCSTMQDSSDNFLNSGSIVISKILPSENISTAQSDIDDFEGMNQLLGYFPPSEEFTPAFNETWLEIRKGKASLMQGGVVIDRINVEGLNLAKSGYYFVNSKELEPLWAAPSTYFTSRGLSIPENNKRSGAYGEMAIFTTGGLVLHSAPVWTSEVGGLKFSQKKLTKLFSSLPLGSQIVVK